MAEPIAELSGVRVLGGHGLGVPAGVKVDLAFQPTVIDIREVKAPLVPIDITLLPSGVDPSDVVLPRTQSLTVPYAEIVALEIGGPGAQRTGLEFWGGGFGLEGAAEGILLATALNLLTTRTKIDTVICFQTPSAELFLHHKGETPDALRIRLSQVFNILRQERNATNTGGLAEKSTRDDVVARLAKLEEMLSQGLLTRSEFDTLKRAVLNEPPPNHPGLT